MPTICSIEAVIAHEYFHNWTGDRVTCRDWFQLSLKEGLTVFRDQEFTADLHSRGGQADRATSRRCARRSSSRMPGRSPIRSAPRATSRSTTSTPTTVYEKGAEVIRMLHTLIGEDAFQRGMRALFRAPRRPGGDLRGLRRARWRTPRAATSPSSAAGTARPARRGSRSTGSYDAGAQTLHARASRQTTPPTPGQPDKLPLHIPLALALLDRRRRRELPLQLDGETAPAGHRRACSS